MPINNSRETRRSIHPRYRQHRGRCNVTVYVSREIALVSFVSEYDVESCDESEMNTRESNGE